MARRRFGIFNRNSEEKPKDEGWELQIEPIAETEAMSEGGPGDPGASEFIPPGQEPADQADQGSGSDTSDWEPADLWSAPIAGRVKDTGPGPAPGAAPDPEPEQFLPPQVQGPATAGGTEAPGEPASDDAVERIRVAAETAAEERAMDEILALEDDLERAKEEAAGHLKVIEDRLGEAERRASEEQRRAEDAERRAAEAEQRIGDVEQQASTPTEPAEHESVPAPEVIERARAEAEDQGRASAAAWLRDQLGAAREESDKRLAQAVDQARTETEQQLRAELEAPGAEATGPGDDDELPTLRAELAEARSELERLRARPPIAATQPLKSGPDTEVQEALGQVQLAETRATEAKRAQAEAERRAREDVERQVQTRTADLERELETLRAELDERVGEAADAARAQAEEKAGAEAERRAKDATDAARREIEDMALGSAETTRREVEQRAGAEAQERAEAEIERIRAEAGERTRIEVEAARMAAEDRFETELQLREQELEQEREEKTQIIDTSDKRLEEIEQRALAAAERVADAERELASEAVRLQDDAERRIAEETKRAQREATEQANAAVRERESELERARTEAEQAKSEADRTGRAEEVARLTAEADSARQRAIGEAVAEVEQQAATREAELKAALGNERAEKSKSLTEVERGLQEAAERARSAEDVAARTAVEVRTAASMWLRTQTEALRREGERRAQAPVRESLAEVERKATATLEARLAEQADKLAKEADSRVSREVADARRIADQDADGRLRAREEELVRKTASIEDELAATRRQLEEANARATTAERRATAAELGARRELARDREERFKEIEGRIGAVGEHAEEVAERAHSAPATSGATPVNVADQVETSEATTPGAFEATAGTDTEDGGHEEAGREPESPAGPDEPDASEPPAVHESDWAAIEPSPLDHGPSSHAPSTGAEPTLTLDEPGPVADEAQPKRRLGGRRRSSSRAGGGEVQGRLTMRDILRPREQPESSVPAAEESEDEDVLEADDLTPTPDPEEIAHPAGDDEVAQAQVAEPGQFENHPASIAELAAEAERLGPEAEGGSGASEADLEPPTWIAGEPEPLEPDAGWMAADELEGDPDEPELEPDQDATEEPEDVPELEAEAEGESDETEIEPGETEETEPDLGQPMADAGGAGPEEGLSAASDELEPTTTAEAPEGTISLSEADFDELRQLGMSVPQAKRVLRYGDEHGGFNSLDELDDVPGFPRGFLNAVKEHLVP